MQRHLRKNGSPPELDAKVGEVSNQDVRRAYGQYYMHANKTTVASEPRAKLVPHAGPVIAFHSVHAGRQKYDG